MNLPVFLGIALCLASGSVTGFEPDSHCATSDALDTYLEGLYRLQQSRLKSADLEGLSPPLLQDGVWIIETDPSMLAFDNPLDLAGSSVRFSPNGAGYDVSLEILQYDDVVGTEVITDAASRMSVRVDLSGFFFPFNGSSYSSVWVWTDLGMRFDALDATGLYAGSQFGTSSADLGSNLLGDQADRIAPLFFATGGNMGRYVYVKEDPGELTVTWRRSLDPAASPFYVDVQAKLFANGDVLVSYKTIKGVENGAPLLFFDISGWLGGFDSRAMAADANDGIHPPLDILNVEVREDPASDMIRFTTNVADTIPETDPQEVWYWLNLDQGGSQIYTIYTWISGGRNPVYLYHWPTQATVLLGAAAYQGSSWDVMMSLSDLPELSAGQIDLSVQTYSGTSSTPDDQVNLAATPTGGSSFSRDLSLEAPFTSSRPIVEAFTYPELIPQGVKAALLNHTGWDETRIDGIPIYQAFFTDLLLISTQAYYTAGNCAAANIGRCDPALPAAPGLLHMNKVNFDLNNSNEPWRFLVLSHEFGHHWLYQVLIDEGGGADPVLSPASAHPAPYVDTRGLMTVETPTDHSVLGGCWWEDNLDGTFSSPPSVSSYDFADHSLYLMGLKAPESVSPWFYLADTSLGLERSCASGITVSGTRHNVTIDMLTDAMGLRAPAYPTTKRDFFTPMVLLVRPGQTPSHGDWDFIMSVRDPWRSYFNQQTEQLGTVTTISPREVSPPGAAPLRLEKVADSSDLRFVFEDPEFGDQVVYNLYEGLLDGDFDDFATHSCSLEPSPSGDSLAFTATPTSTNGSYYYLLTMSNVAFEGGFGNRSDGSPRSTSSSRCVP